MNGKKRGGSKILNVEFQGCFIFHIFKFSLNCWFTTLAKDSRHAWSLLGANISHLELGANISHLELGANISHLELGANISHLELGANISHLELGANISHLEAAGVSFN